MLDEVFIILKSFFSSVFSLMFDMLISSLILFSGIKNVNNKELVAPIIAAILSLMIEFFII